MCDPKVPVLSINQSNLYLLYKHWFYVKKFSMHNVSTSIFTLGVPGVPFALNLISLINENA